MQVEPNAITAAAAAAGHTADRGGMASSHPPHAASTSACKGPVLLKRGEGEWGCSHYRRRCKIVSPCCGEVFWCRHCHNQVMMEDEPDPKLRHELDRRAVRELICAMCNMRQPVADHCRGCGAAFGAYTCLKCSFFDDEREQKLFHCDACGICRVGPQENFFHCETCGCCYAKSLEGAHVCVQNSMRQNCPVCFEFLFDSVRPTAVLPCGHTIHSDCLKELQKNHQTTCPICMKSYGDMHEVWARLDMEVAATEMPPEYRNWKVELMCNDCHHTDRCKFHIVGQKCPSCGSYNTRRMNVLRIAPDAVPCAGADVPPPLAAP